jgi:hypothetical protein
MMGPQSVERDGNTVTARPSARRAAAAADAVVQEAEDVRA